MAQLKKAPAATDVTPLRLLTGTGVREVLLLVPLPSSPSRLLPQHFTVPPEISAQTWSYPAAMPTAFSEARAVGSPSSSLMGSPQHLTPVPTSVQVEL